MQEISEEMESCLVRMRQLEDPESLEAEKLLMEFAFYKDLFELEKKIFDSF